MLYARRGGHFYDFSGVSGLDCAEDSRSFAVTDFDGDGNLDVLLKSRLGPQVRAFRNAWGTGRNAIAFDLQGTQSNRDAIGARVEVECAGRLTVKTLQAGSGYLSQHTKRLHFGLGDSSEARRIRIRWPSGTMQVFENLPAGFRYRILEGSNEITRAPFLARVTPQPQAAIIGENQPRIRAGVAAGAGSLAGAKPCGETRAGVPVPVLGVWSGASSRRAFEIVDLAAAPPDRAACYALFRTYLFDYRAPMSLPLLFLVDERGFAHKVYPAVPDVSFPQGGPAGSARTAIVFGMRSHSPASITPRHGATIFGLGRLFIGRAILKRR